LYFVLLIALIVWMLCTPFIAKYKILVNPDEGSFLYCGREMLTGKKLYRDLRDNKPLGIYLITMAIFKLGFNGEKSVQVGRLINATILSFNSVLLYILTTTMFGDERMGLVAALVFGLTIANPIWEAVCMMTENFGTFFLLTSLVIALKGDVASFGLAGILVGTAILIKQSFLLTAPTVLFLIFQETGFGLYFLSNSILFLGGLVLPVIASCVYIRHRGLTRDMIYMMKNNAKATDFYSPSQLLYHAYFVSLMNPLLSLLGLLGMIGVVSSMTTHDFNLNSFFLIIWLLLCLPQLFLAPPWMHSLTIFLPPLAILSGFFLGFLLDIPCFEASVYFWALIGLGLMANIRSHVKWTLQYFHNSKRFQELVDHIRLNTNPSELVYMFPTQPHIFLFCDRVSGSRWHIYNNQSIVAYKESLNEVTEDLSKNRPLIIMDEVGLSSFMGIRRKGVKDKLCEFLSRTSEDFKVIHRIGNYVILVPRSISKVGVNP